MRGEVCRLQSLDGNMRVDLRGREAGVPEQSLHTPEISSVIEKMSRKTMAQFMGRQISGQPSLGQPKLQ